MKYCKKCTMPNTRPGIIFDNEGVCSACRNYEKRKNVNWDKRWEELKDICRKYRGCNGAGNYDCAIAVSGGKDSHFQVYVMKELMNMNPILFSVEDNFPMTEAGKSNIKNISEEFGCPIISYKPNIKAQKKAMRAMFEKYGKPTWFVDRYIYTYPLHMAKLLNIQLLVYGENIAYEYGGEDEEETYSARNQVKNGVACDVSTEELLSFGLNEEDLIWINPPGEEDLEKLDPIYLSYFLNWNSYSNYLFAKSRGFKDLRHEWERSHHAEQFDQVDSRAYLVHPWLKYPKFGHASATDYTARFIRYGLLTREEGIEIIKKRDHDLDPKCVEDFCDFCGYTKTEFYKIVDNFYNKELFEKNEFGEWKLINPIWEQ